MSQGCSRGATEAPAEVWGWTRSCFVNATLPKETETGPCFSAPGRLDAQFTLVCAVSTFLHSPSKPWVQIFAPTRVDFCFQFLLPCCSCSPSFQFGLK